MKALTIRQPWADLIACGVKPMKALTIRQPYAGLIACGVKTVEFRKRRVVSMIGERFAVHAGKAPSGWRLLATEPHSAVIAVATLAECRLPTEEDEDQPGSGAGVQFTWAWVLSDVVALPEPVPCRGRQGWWNLPPDVEAEVLRQLKC